MGTSRGGRNTKIHALSDPLCRLVDFRLSGGQVADIKGGERLMFNAKLAPVLIADKAYDCTRMRRSLAARKIAVVIPNKRNRKRPYPHDEQAYKDRNVVERMFCRLKDFRRIATRYDKLARNYLSALCLAAITAYWIN